jgi:hypothetical protein
MSWTVEYAGVMVSVDGDAIANVRDDTGTVEVTTSLVSVQLSNGVESDLTVEHLLALLDVESSLRTSSLEALPSVPLQEAVTTRRALDTTHMLPGINVEVGRTNVKLLGYGEQLLEITTASIIGILQHHMTALDVRLTPLDVRTGLGNQRASTFRISATELNPGKAPKVTLRHDFADAGDSSFPPWRGVLEMLAADSRFATHQQSLMAACTDLPVAGLASKRPREDDSSDKGPSTLRRRL